MCFMLVPTVLGSVCYYPKRISLFASSSLIVRDDLVPDLCSRISSEASSVDIVVATRAINLHL
jgi:hypothetical protein